MNILVTLNSGYIKPLCAMLRSLLKTHPDIFFEIYVINKSLSEDDFIFLQNNISENNYCLHDIKISDDMLDSAPVTDRYPTEMYYRIFAAKFLPCDIDRILYLDPDLIVLKNLEELYNIDLGENFFAAASHVGKHLQKINELRLQMYNKGPYINSGVMLMNIKLLREHQNFSTVLNYIEKNKNILILPDQDVISAVYASKIVTIDPYIYNMTERLLISPRSIKKDIDTLWVKENSAIIHYCGRNKPWKRNYIGFLGEFYRQHSYGLDN